MFFLQEYQHVHLLWFKKRSFTLVWKPNPPLRSVRCAHLRAHADAASVNQALPTKKKSASLHNGRALLPLCIRAASALPLLCLRVRCETGVNQALLKLSRWKRLSSGDQWNLTPATMCHGSAARCMKPTLWSSADHALAQVRPRQFLLAHSQKMLAV